MSTSRNVNVLRLMHRLRELVTFTDEDDLPLNEWHDVTILACVKRTSTDTVIGEMAYDVKSMRREPGKYWVTINGDTFVAVYDGIAWKRAGQQVDPSTFDSVGPRIDPQWKKIVPKDPSNFSLLFWKVTESRVMCIADADIYGEPNPYRMVTMSLDQFTELRKCCD